MLFLNLLERMALSALAAYIFSQTRMFRRLIKDKLQINDKIIMVVFFSIISVTGTYMGINFRGNALANTRPIGAIVAGYIGGPLVGLIVGIIAGTHRYFLGGFTALSCGISTVAEGLIGGIFKRLSKDKTFSRRWGLVAGLAAEIAQVVIIMLVSKPYESSLALEKVIGFPMVAVNSLGVMIFVDIIKKAKSEYEKTRSEQAQKALTITRKTMEYLKEGINEESVRNVARVIWETGNLNGVFITYDNKAPVYAGEGTDMKRLEECLRGYSQNFESRIISFDDNFGRQNFFCCPIKESEDKITGILGIKVISESDVDKYFIDFSKGLSDLLALQVRMHKLDRLAQAASTAELKALRAQIHPHFLYNALSTISAFCRTNPDRARELITNLSVYFRNTLGKEEDFVPLNKELELVESYMTIEKARLGSRLRISVEVPEDVLPVMVPSFMLQQLVENSVKHGISPKAEGGCVYIRASRTGYGIEFTVEDTGMGMTEERYREVITKWPGVGLKNISERLKLLYGPGSSLNIRSAPGVGTKISFTIP